MKEVTNALCDFLLADAELVSLTGHAEGDERILRQAQAMAPKFPVVLVGKSTEMRVVKGLAQPREFAFSIIVFAEDENLASDIKDRLIAVLHYADISNGAIHCYGVKWDDLAEGPYWDDTAKSYRVDTRFLVWARKREKEIPWPGKGGYGQAPYG